MKWSWRIGRIAGIGIYMHATFLILLAWVAISNYLPSRSVASALSGVGFILSLFGIVVLHELGHALAARRFGIRTRDITLLPIGGVARLERMPERPRQELVVALAGPAVNVVLAGVLFVALVPTAGARLVQPDAVLEAGILVRLMWINVTLAVFNLLPAFPMDGGRVLRALLAMRIEYVRATQIAAHVGQAMALVLGLIGLLYQPFLMFIALFVWMGADQEASLVKMKSALGGIPISHAMVTEFESLAPDRPLSDAVEKILDGFQQDFPVVQDGRVLGLLTRRHLLEALSTHGQEGAIGDVMEREFEVAHPSEMMELVFARLQGRACHSLPVIQDGQVIGMVDADNIGEFLMIQSALRRK